MPQSTFTTGLTMKDNVSLILTKFTTIIINTIIAMPFTSNNLFHVKVTNINSPGSNPTSNHINIHIVIDPHTHVFVILNITHHIYFVNPINVSAHSISNAGGMGRQAWAGWQVGRGAGRHGQAGRQRLF